jgi:hypothetical protein
MARVTGLWVYQLLGDPPDPEAVVARAHRHGLRWVTAQAIRGDEVLDRDWLRGMRRATTKHDMRLGVHGRLGQRGGPKPAAEARAMAQAIDIADADFAIVNAEREYEASPTPDSKEFVRAYRRRKPDFLTYFSSFGRPDKHPSLDWAAWADGRFRGMPQAYENLNAAALKPAQCVAAWARFFERGGLRPTLGCFAEHGHPHLPIPRLVRSVRDVPELAFNVYRHGTVTTAELHALSEIA